MSLKIKICGMRDKENILDVAELKPDLIGFIFYPASPRYAAGLPDNMMFEQSLTGIRKAGVFVDADFDEITKTINKYSLDIIQLHGHETPDFCHRIKNEGVDVIKVFNIYGSDDFRACGKYTECTDYFLFDTLTAVHGGSGHKFDWKILDSYNSEHPFFLSGGISSIDAVDILAINNPSFYGIDLNSRFEIKPGLKDIEKLRSFISEIRQNNK